MVAAARGAGALDAGFAASQKIDHVCGPCHSSLACRTRGCHVGSQSQESCSGGGDVVKTAEVLKKETGFAGLVAAMVAEYRSDLSWNVKTVKQI